MRSVDEIINVYRRVDDYHRYLVSNKERLEKMKRIFSENREFFGKKVLDIGAGGGVLGIVAKDEIEKYLGIDINPDIVEAAKPVLEKEGLEIILGDARTVKIPGKYDTVVMLGNALGHLTTKQFVEILENIKPNLEEKAHFIIDYRDWVGMYYRGEWDKVYRLKDGVAITEGINTITGEVNIVKVGYESKDIVRYTQTIWAPFILEPMMEVFGWELVKRKEEPEWGGWFDVYKKY